MEKTYAIDIARGKQVAKLLYDAFSSTGIHGRKDMPEDIEPADVRKGSLEHILFITLTVSIDYGREADLLWGNARRTFDDPQTNYLFVPELLHKASFQQVINDMQKHGLSKKPNRDAWIWKSVGVTFFKKWSGDPYVFLQNCNLDALEVIAHLKKDRHPQGRRQVNDFPYLRGPKISCLWLRMLRDNVGISYLKNLEKVPIPVDIHVARATLALGIIRGQIKGTRLGTVFEDI
jgi:hypothetical protein